jgi:hypothetical protein
MIWKKILNVEIKKYIVVGIELFDVYYYILRYLIKHMTQEEETKLIKYRAFLVSECERFHDKSCSKNSSKIGSSYDHGFACGLIHARTELEELFKLWD